MKISPRELREAQIPSKAFGFNQDVVDALLERAADTIEGLIEENRQLFETIERLKGEGSSTSVEDPFVGIEPDKQEEENGVGQVSSQTPSQVDSAILLAQVAEKEELINKTLMLAQKTADETVKTAKSQADTLVAQAKEQAQILVDNAQANADSLTGEAKDQADNELRAAQEQAQNLIAAAQTQAEEMVTEAQNKADLIHAEERNRFVELVSTLKNERAQLLSDIEILQGFDNTNRSKLKEILLNDLQTLEVRERVDVGDIPELPIVEPIDKPQVAAHSIENLNVDNDSDNESDDETVKDELPQSFDAIFQEPQVEEQHVEVPQDEVLEVDEIDVESFGEIETVEPAGGTEPKYQSDDPFAAFVDPEQSDSYKSDQIIDAQVVEPASDELASSDSLGAFAPGTSNPALAPLDDDDFFASLREAVQDDSPLGPSDNDDGPKRKGRFKK